MTPPDCFAAWFNDPETDHVHRCTEPASHDSYHRCGHEYDWDKQLNVPMVCGVQW